MLSEHVRNPITEHVRFCLGVQAYLIKLGAKERGEFSLSHHPATIGLRVDFSQALTSPVDVRVAVHCAGGRSVLGAGVFRQLATVGELGLQVGKLTIGL